MYFRAQLDVGHIRKMQPYGIICDYMRKSNFSIYGKFWKIATELATASYVSFTTELIYNAFFNVAFCYKKFVCYNNLSISEFYDRTSL